MRPTAGRCPSGTTSPHDVCDKHPRDKPAMVWESFDGSTRRARLGRAAGPREPGGAHARGRAASSGATASPSSCRRRRRPRPSSSASGSSARSCSRCRCSTATTAIEHRLARLGRAACSSPTRRTRRASTGRGRRDAARARAGDARRRADRAFVCADTAADDPAQLYYTSGTTGLAKGIVHAHRYLLAPRGVRLLPRGAGRRALPRHGRVGVGGRDRAAARPVAARRGAVRLPARGRLRPAQAARLPQPPPRDERLHDADGDALDDGGRRRRHALPAARSAASARPASR